MTQRYPSVGEYNPTVPSRIIFGQGKADSLAAEVEALGGKRALVLSGRAVAERTGTVRQVNAALGGMSAGVYSGLTQRAPLATAVEAANLAVSTGTDTLVGVGGSTISDAARMIAVLMAEGVTTVEELRDLGHRNGGMLSPDLTGKPLPLQVSIPTTLSAGEFNMGGGNVLDDQGRSQDSGAASGTVRRPDRAGPGHDHRHPGLAVAFHWRQGLGPLHRTTV